MFYLLSKTLYFFIQPSVWVMICVLLALISRSDIWRRRALRFSLILFLLFGNRFLFNEIMLTLEPEQQSISIGEYNVAIVLGGFTGKNTRGGDVEFFSSVDRLNKAIALFHERKVNHLLISGGYHVEGHPEWSESLLTSEWLESCGVPKDKIIVENKSWNTHENAHYTKALIDSLETNGPFLVLTSASHMKRAKACFNKEGLTADFLPVDHYSSSLGYSWADFIFPSMRTVLDWEVPIKEWIGLIVYRLQGYA